MKHRKIVISYMDGDAQVFETDDNPFEIDWLPGHHTCIAFYLNDVEVGAVYAPPEDE